MVGRSSQKRLRFVMLGCLGNLAVPAAAAAALAAKLPASSPGCSSPRPVAAEVMTLSIAGDLIGPYLPIAAGDPRIDDVIEKVTSSDGGFANQEGSIFDVATFDGPLGAEDGGGHPLGSAAVAASLAKAGFTMLSKANNHAVDFGFEGLAATERNLKEAGISFAGSGADLETARAPVCRDGKSGRFALVAAASTYPDMAAAAYRQQYAGVMLRGRPGINALRLIETIFVTPREMNSLRAMGKRRGWDEAPIGQLNAFDLHTGSQTYQIGPVPRVHYDVDQTDLMGLRGSIRKAKAASNLVVFSIHAHETESGSIDDPNPADFLPALFHAMIDAGADVVVRHGPHSLSGIEIYHGCAIFYGLASLFNGLGDEHRQFRGATLPKDWDDGIIAKIRIVGGKLREVRLIPVVTIREKGRALGAPRLASHGEAIRIIATIQENSRRYGTVVDQDGDTGVVRLTS